MTVIFKDYAVPPNGDSFIDEVSLISVTFDNHIIFISHDTVFTAPADVSFKVI